MKAWYIVKHKKEKNWTAYELNEPETKLLKSGYEIRGPYVSLVLCLIAAQKGK